MYSMISRGDLGCFICRSEELAATFLKTYRCFTLENSTILCIYNATDSIQMIADENHLMAFPFSLLTWKENKGL